MRNRMYGGVRGRKTKVGEKLLRFPPTRFYIENFCCLKNLSEKLQGIEIDYSCRDCHEGGVETV